MLQNIKHYYDKKVWMKCDLGTGYSDFCKRQVLVVQYIGLNECFFCFMS